MPPPLCRRLTPLPTLLPNHPFFTLLLYHFNCISDTNIFATTCPFRPKRATAWLRDEAPRRRDAMCLMAACRRGCNTCSARFSSARSTNRLPTQGPNPTIQRWRPQRGPRRERLAGARPMRHTICLALLATFAARASCEVRGGWRPGPSVCPLRVGLLLSRRKAGLLACSRLPRRSQRLTMAAGAHIDRRSGCCPSCTGFLNPSRSPADALPARAAAVAFRHPARRLHGF